MIAAKPIAGTASRSQVYFLTINWFFKSLVTQQPFNNPRANFDDNSDNDPTPVEEAASSIPNLAAPFEKTAWVIIFWTDLKSFLLRSKPLIFWRLHGKFFTQLTKKHIRRLYGQPKTLKRPKGSWIRRKMLSESTGNTIINFAKKTGDGTKSFA